MATAPVNSAAVLTGPGILYWAPTGTTEPATTVTGGTLSSAAWNSAWVALGSTADGHTFSDSISTEDITVAESMYPLRVVTTGREASWALSLAEVNAQNLKIALNGGALEAGDSTGTGATALTTLGPPDIGGEIRGMLGWQSEDDTVRLVAPQVLQVGDLSASFNKGANNTVLAVKFRFEKPAAADPYTIYLAGAVRSGVA